MSINLSLDRIRNLFNHLPVPYTRPTIHVAGTNGKGSVCALVTSILAATSPPLVVGRFNSPHLLSPLDGIVVQNKPVDRDVFMRAQEEIRQIDEENAIGASLFEMYTCLALLVFERLKVDVVVLEVGMGGRLDATNVVPDACILVSALTAVDLDHQAFLGDTVEAIAREKAAIARPGKPFVVGPQTHPQVDDVARSVIESVGGDLAVPCTIRAVEWDEGLDGRPMSPTQAQAGGIRVPLFQPVRIDGPCFADPIRALLPLHGEHQLANLGTAMGIVSALQTHPSCARPQLRFGQRLTADAISRGIRATRWPGRLSYHTLSLPSNASDTDTDPDLSQSQILVLADGAHNPASATALAAYLSSVLDKPGDGRPLTLTYILALSHSPPKTPEQTLEPLLALRVRSPKRNVRLAVALLPFTPPANMPWVKFVPPPDVRKAIESLVPHASVDVVESSSDFSGLAAQVGFAAPSELPPPPRTEHVEEALRWAASRRRDGEDALVVLAGSLYLVADFYRLLENLGQAEEIWGASC